jgi:hypothetical protein
MFGHVTTSSSKGVKTLVKESQGLKTEQLNMSMVLEEQLVP